MQQHICFSWGASPAAENSTNTARDRGTFPTVFSLKPFASYMESSDLCYAQQWRKNRMFFWWRWLLRKNAARPVSYHCQHLFIGVIYEVLIAPQADKQWCESYLLWLDMYNRLVISSGRLWWCDMRILPVITCENDPLYCTSPAHWALLPWCPCYWLGALIMFTASPPRSFPIDWKSVPRHVFWIGMSNVVFI